MHPSFLYLYAIIHNKDHKRYIKNNVGLWFVASFAVPFFKTETEIFIVNAQVVSSVIHLTNTYKFEIQSINSIPISSKRKSLIRVTNSNASVSIVPTFNNISKLINY